MEPATMTAIGMVGAAGIGYLGAQQQGQMDRREAEINRGFQERMRSTAMQTHTQDLKAAGLNPILAAGGGGAAQPAGDSASGSPDPMSTGLSSALGVLQARQEFKSREITDELNIVDGFKKQAEEKLIHAEKTKTQRAADGELLRNEQTTLQNKLISETMPSLIKKAKAEGDWSQVNQMLNAIKSGASSASDIKDIVNPITIKSGK